MRHATPYSRLRDAAAGLATIILALCVSHTSATAARDATSSSSGTPVFRLIIVESPSCSYCQVLRRDVVPIYRASKRDEEAPISFVDVNDIASDTIKLTSPLTLLPTAIVLKHGREIGRVESYWGYDTFLMMVDRIIDGAR
ncbi:MAG: hypothetical protein AAGC70_12960 [Pseudomonadota bacterium]